MIYVRSKHNNVCIIFKEETSNTHFNQIVFSQYTESTIASFSLHYLLCFCIVLLHLLVQQYIPYTTSQRNTCNNEHWLLGKTQFRFRNTVLLHLLYYVFWQLNVQQQFVLLLISFFTVLFIGENLTENLQYQDIESPVVCHPNKQPKVVQELGQTASLRCRVSIFCIVVGYSCCTC